MIVTQNLPPRVVPRKIRWQRFGNADLDAVSIRLDAGAYCTADKAALLGVPTTPLSDLADVYQPTIFGKKSMQGTPTHGIPLYSSSGMLLQSPEPTYHISRQFEARLKQSLGVREGTILVSRSGTIGLVTIVTPERAGFLVDDHMIRIVPKHDRDRGLLFTYLSSRLGQQLLDSLAYGAVQKEIKAFQLESISIPQLSNGATARIADNVAKANRLQSEAVSLHNSALAKVMQSNQLPTLTERQPKPVVNGRTINAFSCPLSAISGSSNGAAETRLEAHFHNLIARAAIANLRDGHSKTYTVGDLTESVFFCNRFTRTFVEEDHGIPYLVGKNIVQVRPQIEKYLSIAETEELDAYKLRRGWTLITCSGTIGRTCFVWRNFEDWVATHDLIRVIPREDAADPGYLYAFLSCPYGFEQIYRFRHGSVVDHVTPEQITQVVVALPSETHQKEIGDQVRKAFEKRAEALELEDESQQIMMSEIAGLTAASKDCQNV